MSDRMFLDWCPLPTKIFTFRKYLPWFGFTVKDGNSWPPTYTEVTVTPKCYRYQLGGHWWEAWYAWSVKHRVLVCVPPRRIKEYESNERYTSPHRRQ